MTARRGGETTGTGDGSAARDQAAVLRFIERFAADLADTGWPRMPARVFVALLTSDSGGRTAGELADLLRVSPAAISGAVRYLVPLGLARREREPGSRRDHYRVPDDVWYEVIRLREQITARWAPVLEEGIKALGDGTPAARRLEETAAFFDFVRNEGAGLLARWHKHRASLGLPERS
ncbi:MAG: GbsR/MarR family transcriptional regulator [Micromonosporaceae bacterium]